MRVILSQKVDTESLYEDELFSVYHYPARYKNQLNPGDTFVYYQGNRYDQKQRYYFGTGMVNTIHFDHDDYYAKLVCCRKFSTIVPIYLPGGGYIEQLGYEEVRQSINPPWQSSIRPISQPAYDYIIDHAGILIEPQPDLSVEQLSENIKKATRGYFLNHTNLSLLDIERNAHRLAELLCSSVPVSTDENKTEVVPQDFIAYCENMRISYSYKPLLLLALFDRGDCDGAISLNEAAAYFLRYYETRRLMGQLVETKPCIYRENGIGIEASMANIQANPVKALLGSGFFEFDRKTKIFRLNKQLWEKLTASDIVRIRNACIDKLNHYYGEG